MLHPDPKPFIYSTRISGAEAHPRHIQAAGPSHPRAGPPQRAAGTAATATA